MTQADDMSRRRLLATAAGITALGTLGAAAAAAELPEGHYGTKRSALKEPGPMVPPCPAILLTVNGMPGDPDEISVVWTFVVEGEPPQVGVSVRDQHVAQKLIEHHGEFVLNLPVARIVRNFDTVDMNSTKIGDKFKLASLTRGKATVVDAPTVEECPLQVECRVFDKLRVPPRRKLFLANVVATTALEGAVDADGKLIVPNVPFFGMTAGSGQFYTMGEAVGNIGFTLGRHDIKY